MVELTEQNLKEIAQAVQNANTECGFVEMWKTGCQLSNNITVYTEIAVGVSLGIIFFVLQWKSTRSKSKIWSDKRNDTYGFILSVIDEHSEIIHKDYKSTYKSFKDRSREIEINSRAIKHTLEKLAENFSVILKAQSEWIDSDDEDFMHGQIIHAKNINSIFEYILNSKNRNDYTYQRHIKKIRGILIRLKTLSDKAEKEIPGLSLAEEIPYRIKLMRLLIKEKIFRQK